MNLTRITRNYEFTGAKREVISALRGEGFVVSRPATTYTGAQEYKIHNGGGDSLGTLVVPNKGLNRTRYLTIVGRPSLNSRLKNFADNYGTEKV
ncbi:MAG: hypothetical protein AABX07_00030 [Nanoarchaeota archaeon]